MLTPRQVLDTYFLEARRDLLEVAALLDRYDAAVERNPDSVTEEDAKLTVLRQALAQLADPSSASNERTADLLKLFATI